MKSYLVNIPAVDLGDGNWLWVNGEIRAKTWDEAEEIAEREGYELVGPLLDNTDAEEIEAMIDARDATLN
jgi:hypothetical protein